MNSQEIAVTIIFVSLFHCISIIVVAMLVKDRK